MNKLLWKEVLEEEWERRRLLELLVEASNKFPELRVMQLVANALMHAGRSNPDVYYIENKYLYNALEKYIGWQDEQGRSPGTGKKETPTPDRADDVGSIE